MQQGNGVAISIPSRIRRCAAGIRENIRACVATKTKQTNLTKHDDKTKSLTSLPCAAPAEPLPAPAVAVSDGAVAPEALGELSDTSESFPTGAGAVGGTALASGGTALASGGTAAAASYVSSAQFPVGCDREAIFGGKQGTGSGTGGGA